MYTLYYSPFACSFAVHAALEKIGEPVELVKIDIYKKEHLQPEFLAINPRAQVPVLKQGDTVVTQASAILLYLSERHPEAGLMPAPNSEAWVMALQGLFYLSNTLHPLFLRVFYPERLSQVAPEDVSALGLEKIAESFKEFDGLFASQAYIAGDTLSAPDYYLFAMLNWLHVHPVDISGMEHLQGFIHRMRSHPEVVQVLEKEMQAMAA